MTTSQQRNASEQKSFEEWSDASAIRRDLGAEDAWHARAKSDETAALKMLLSQIVQDGYLSDTSKHRIRMALDYPGRTIEQMRDDILEEAAVICDEVSCDRYDQYKGRGKHAPNNPQRADTFTNGESDGAAACADLIRARKKSI